MKNWKTAGALKAQKAVKARAWQQYSVAKDEANAAWEKLSEVKANGKASKADYAKAVSAFSAAKEWANACRDFYAAAKARVEEAEKACEPEDLKELEQFSKQRKPVQKSKGIYTKPDGSDATQDPEFIPF